MSADRTPQPSPNQSPPLLTAITVTVERLQDDALGRGTEKSRQQARATLSRLRRSVGIRPENDPLAWQQVIDLLMPALPEDHLGTGESPSPSEAASFDALSLFALHMQGAQGPAHRRGRSFGTAIGLLADSRESKSIRPRMDALLSAREHASRMQHARSLVTLLRGSQPIPFDYGRFALDLRTLAGPDPDGVLLRWGRDVVTGPRRERSRADGSSTPGLADTATHSAH
ncbi:type I-E CRISPR-associated protein Cse2/CasB [Brachybacterium muris]|uniref:type I-E CRISPR-associated protein Cse2/CasB n=1 Tax=Brachybacterium muris TaxID=219301 RepID=UPI0021A7F7D1|nr:type I-E CRISPR-associated protein Cse2/CasB [Brachybacterium muris]MCT1996750.1 type I-E CRISPR-associated protein Cse2/CasB [Brachybacterium muris]